MYACIYVHVLPLMPGIAEKAQREADSRASDLAYIYL